MYKHRWLASELAAGLVKNLDPSAPSQTGETEVSKGGTQKKNWEPHAYSNLLWTELV